MSRKNQERTEAHEEMETRKLRKEAEKTSTRERTVLVSQRGEGGRGRGRGERKFYYQVFMFPYCLVL